MSDSRNWDETQARLLKDIEAFARSKPDLAAADAGATARPRQAGLPAIDAQAASAQRQAQAEKPQTPAPQAAPPAAPAGGLLEKLKREALAKQMTESQHFSLQVQKQRFISEALDGAFHYLREFCEQLNILKPAYPLSYSLMNVVSFDRLVWQEGRADFRMLPGAAEDRLYEQVTLRFRLASGQELRVERESPAHEAFRNALFENNITFKEEGVRNDRGHIAHMSFAFPCEVKAGLIFVADYKVGDIRLQLRNLQRFGATEYRLPPEALTQEAFEELAHLLLGEQSRFEKMFRRVA